MCEGHTAGRAAGPNGAWQRSEEGHRCERHSSPAGSTARVAGTLGERAAYCSKEELRVLLWGLQGGMAALAPGFA